MIKVAIFSKIRDTQLTSIVHKLEHWNVQVLKRYDVTRVRHTDLSNVDCCLYLYEYTSHAEFDRACRIAERQKKRVFAVSRKEGVWLEQLSTVFRHFGKAMAHPSPEPVEEVTPKEEPRPIAVVPEPELEVPEPPPTAPALPPESATVPVAKPAAEPAYVQALEAEVDELRRRITNLEEVNFGLMERVKRAERLKTGTVVKLETPDEIIASLRTLAAQGLMSAVEVVDKIALFAQASSGTSSSKSSTRRAAATPAGSTDASALPLFSSVG